jgi:hypothetical protein
LSNKELRDRLSKTVKTSANESYDLNESFSAGFTLAPFARDYGITVQTSFEHHPDVQGQIDAMEEGINKPLRSFIKK